MATKNCTRSNNWAFVAYPESLPENWIGIINSYHIPWFCSPLHDADLNADETEKKAHYHIILNFESLKTQQQVEEITKDKLNATVPIIVKSMKGYLDTYLAPTKNDRDLIYDKMIDWIEENDITEFSDLANYARYNEPDWRSLLYSNSTIFFATYLNSRRNKKAATQKD